MKVGIYLSGLDESFTHETAEKYARRFNRRYDLTNSDVNPNYEIYIDKFEYDKEHKLYTNRISIIEKLNRTPKIVYKYMNSVMLTSLH